MSSRYISIAECGEDNIVRIEDTAGNPLTSVDGSLNVNITGFTPSANVNQIDVYNEVTGVASGIETTVLTYVIGATGVYYLQLISSAASNVTLYMIKRNGIVMDKQYGSWTQYDFEFDYRSNNDLSAGFKLTASDVITVTAIHTSPSLASFNARIQLLQVI